MKFLFKNCFFLAFILLNQNIMAHQMGSVVGMVVDSESKEAIAFVNVLIDNSMEGTTTGLDGRFQIRYIQEGEYNLVISHLGYKTKTIAFSVVKNDTTALHIELTASAFSIDSYTVTADRNYSTASSQLIRRLDMETRSISSSQDLLKLVPGLITAQHAGGGKAEQIYVRGFDCDHGTDVNLSVDGIPVNIVSHAHGQGYADLHFLIPEMVEDIAVYKGPYFAEFGNFSTAAAVTMQTKDHLTNNLFKIEGGQFNTFKSTLLYQPIKGETKQNAIIAAQYYRTNGPFEAPMNLQRFNIHGKYFVNLSPASRLNISVVSFSSAWDASGQIPDRVVKQGIIDRFGAIDKREGGNTSRTNMSLRYDYKDDFNNTLSIQAYYCHYNYKLFSNFTYFLVDTLNGDMIEQVDDRALYGFTATYNMNKLIHKTIYKTALGLGYRSDNANVALWKSPERIRKILTSNSEIFERNMYVWLTEELIFSSKWRLQLGLRADYFTFNVNDLTTSSHDSIQDDTPHASGYVQQLMLNPKINLVYSPSSFIDVYANAGSGFHSNDARNVVLNQQATEMVSIWKEKGFSDEEIRQKQEDNKLDPEQGSATTLPRAIGAELGARFKLFKRLNLGVAAWYLHLEKEFVYVGDGGYSELSNPTQRLGLDIEARLRLTAWLWADADISLSEGRVLGLAAGENHIPLAPNFTLSGGLSMINKNGFNASLRCIHMGDRPANEDNSVVALGYTLFTIGSSYDWKQFSFSVTLENIFDVQWNEAQFDTESRMSWENESVSELHFTPGNPRNIQFGIGVKF